MCLPREPCRRGEAHGDGPSEDPKEFIHKQTCLHTDRAAQQDSETRATLILAYISGLSESIRQILSPLSFRLLF